MAELNGRMYEAIAARAECVLPVKVCFQYDSFNGTVTKAGEQLIFTAHGIKDLSLSFVLNMASVRSVDISDDAFTIYMNVNFEDGARLPFH